MSVSGDAAAALSRGLAAQQHALSTVQRQQLLGYLQLLIRWNRVYNLTGTRDPEAIVDRHLLDCLAAVQPLRRYLRNEPARVLDVGSGAGLPGVVLAIALPQLSVTCIDAVGKKASFIRQVSAELGIANIVAMHGRVELMQAPPFHVVTSRAFASLADFVAPTARLLLPSGVWMAMKGKSPAEEMAVAPSTARVFHVEHLTGTSADERCLVWMSR